MLRPCRAGTSVRGPVYLPCCVKAIVSIRTRFVSASRTALSSLGLVDWHASGVPVLANFADLEVGFPAGAARRSPVAIRMTVGNRLPTRAPCVARRLWFWLHVDVAFAAGLPWLDSSERRDESVSSADGGLRGWSRSLKTFLPAHHRPIRPCGFEPALT